jgi:hypothetical protein
MTPELSNDIEQAVQRHHGCLQVKGQDSSYIVMSVETFREMMGVGTDEELTASLRAIEQGLADIKAGRSRSLDDFFNEFDARHGIHS